MFCLPSVCADSDVIGCWGLKSLACFAVSNLDGISEDQAEKGVRGQPVGMFPVCFVPVPVHLLVQKYYICISSILVQLEWLVPCCCATVESAVLFLALFCPSLSGPNRQNLRALVSVCLSVHVSVLSTSLPPPLPPPSLSYFLLRCVRPWA